MTLRSNRWFGLITALALVSAGAAFAAEPQKGAPPEPTPEARQNMAAVHEKMAACLKSNRSIAECRTEMQASCQSMMGQGGCPMWGSAGMGPGMMGRGPMGPGMMGGGGPPKQGSGN